MSLIVDLFVLLGHYLGFSKVLFQFRDLCKVLLDGFISLLQGFTLSLEFAGKPRNFVLQLKHFSELLV